MFTVPNWSLSTSITKARSSDATGRSTSSSKFSKKRKRKGVLLGNNVSNPWQPGFKTETLPLPSDSRVKNRRCERLKATRTHKRERPDLSSNGHVSLTSDRDNETAYTWNSKESPEKHHQGEWSGTEMDYQKLPTLSGPDLDVQTTVCLTPLQSSMRQKLLSARFRHLNQTLYTTPSEEAALLFERNPIFFDEYHMGFRQQVASWPENPVDYYVQQVRNRGLPQDRMTHDKDKCNSSIKLKETNKSKQLPRTKGRCNIADLGCGDASLAQQLGPNMKNLKITVSSYDLVSNEPKVTKADIARLPVESEVFDVAIFCLALMGSNWIDFIEEAWRALRWGGELWIAEIKSRFGRPHKYRPANFGPGKARQRKRASALQSTKEDAKTIEEELSVEVDGVEAKYDTDVSSFVRVLRRRGFQLVTTDDAIDMSNKMFVMMKFVKSAQPLKGRHVLHGGEKQRPDFFQMRLANEVEDDLDEASVLKPCVYKSR